MKKNDLEKIKSATVADLNKQIVDLKKELTQLNLEKEMKKLKNSRKIFHTRKKLSVFMTILNMKGKTV